MINMDGGCEFYVRMPIISLETFLAGAGNQRA